MSGRSSSFLGEASLDLYADGVDGVSCWGGGRDVAATLNQGLSQNVRLRDGAIERGTGNATAAALRGLLLWASWVDVTRE